MDLRGTQTRIHCNGQSSGDLGVPLQGYGDPGFSGTLRGQDPAGGYSAHRGAGACESKGRWRDLYMGKAIVNKKLNLFSFAKAKLHIAGCIKFKRDTG